MEDGGAVRVLAGIVPGQRHHRRAGGVAGQAERVHNRAGDLFRMAAYSLHHDKSPLGDYLRRRKSNMQNVLERYLLLDLSKVYPVSHFCGCFPWLFPD
jgi:hypothetical protein